MPSRIPALTGIVTLLLVIAAVGPAVVAGQESGQVVGEPDLSFSSSAGALAPGTTTEIPLSVTNRGRIDRAGPEEFESRVTTARGLLVRVESGNTPIEVNTGQLAAGNVPTGTVPTGGISVTVPDGTEPGTYELPVEYSYEQTRIVTYGSGSPEYRDVSISRTGTLEVTVDDRPTFAIVNRTSEALVGQTGQVAITLENTGTQTARDSTVSVTSESGALTFSAGAQTASSYAGRIAPGERRTVTYEATVGESGDAGEYSVELAVEYQDDSGVTERSQPRTLGIPVGAEQEFALRDLESTLRAGYEGQIRGTLVNEGPNVVRDPVAVLTANGDSLTITAGEEAIPDLEPGESTPVNFTVDVSRSARVTRQQFELAVNYDNALGDRLAAGPLRPTVQISPPRDRFRVDVRNATVTAGEGETLEFRVTNQGEEVLRNVRTKAYLESPLSSSDDEGIIDDLEPGETETVAVNVAAGSSALEKAYPVSVDFQYDLPDGDTEVSKTYTVPIEVTTDESGGGFPIVLVGGLVVLGVAGVLLYRRRSA